MLSIFIDIEKGTLEVNGYVEGVAIGGTTYLSVKIGSGKGDCNNKTSCEQKKNKGPTPRGSYTLKVDEISEFSTLGAIYRNYWQGADWGSFRVPLHPNAGTKTFERKGFFLHGGDGIGTAGCVDMGGGTLGNDDTGKFLKLMRSSKYNEITVTVR